MSVYGLPYGLEYGGLAPVAEIAIDKALERVLEQYKEQPNIDKLLRIYVARWQALESLLQSILQFRLLDVATGFLLGVYGKLLDLPKRPGWDDDAWRFYLKAKLRALRSSGTIEDLIVLGELMRATGSTNPVRLWPEYPRGFRIEVPDVPVDLRDLAVELLTIATAAPERGVFVFTTPGEAPFAFRSPGTTYGFGHGRFAGGSSNGEH